MGEDASNLERLTAVEIRTKANTDTGKDHELRIRKVESVGPKLFAWASAGGFAASLLARLLNL